MYKRNILHIVCRTFRPIINVGGIPRRIEFTGGVPSGVSRGTL